MCLPCPALLPQRLCLRFHPCLVQPPRAQQLQQQVAAFLQHAVASLNDVEFSTRVADADEPMAGCVVVEMRSYAAPPSSMAADPSEAALEASRQQAREVRAWHDLISAAVQLLSSAAGPSTSGGASPVPAPSLPRVALVHMSSSLSTQLAICRCRTTSKLLRRSAKVRLGYGSGRRQCVCTSCLVAQDCMYNGCT